MIFINLLPSEMRKPKPHSLFWKIACVLVAALLAATAAMIAHYRLSVIPELESTIAQAQAERDALAAKKSDLDRLRLRAGDLKRYAATVKELYSRRVPWSKALHDVKQAVDAGSGGDGNAVWLTRVAGYGRLLSLEGYVVAPGREAAEAAVNRLAKTIREYKPDASEGLGGVPLGDLLADGFPRVTRIVPEQLRITRNGTQEAIEAVLFALELRFN